MPEEIALVTGASSGIGSELARIHAARGGGLVLVARRRDRLEALRAELEAAHGVSVHVLAKDLAEPSAPEEVHDEVCSLGLDIGYLMNNAGFGGHGLFHERDWKKDEAMIRVNVLALTALTRAFLPAMLERGRGRVLNVASSAGFLPGPLQAVYYATKAYVISFSEAIANELSGTGVTVTALCPSATETEFAEQANVKDTRTFRSAAPAHDVAAYGYASMLAGKPVAVHGASNRLLFHGLLRFLPRGMITRISRSYMEKT